LQKYEPKIHLANGKALKEDGEIAFKFDVVNSSSFDVDSLELNIDVVNRTEQISISNIPANATKTIEGSGEIPEDCEIAYINLLDESLHSNTRRNADTGITIALPSQNPVIVAPVLGKKKFSSLDAIAGQSTRFQIPLLNQSAVQNATVSVALEGPGAATDTKQITLPPEQERTADFKITFPEMGTHTYQLHVESEGQEKTYTFPIEVLGQPDLALAEGDFVVEPEIPVIGKTVRIRTTVYNVGFGPARDISITAYDGDPSLNRTLRPFNHRRVDGISILQPGEILMPTKGKECMRFTLWWIRMSESMKPVNATIESISL